MALSNYVEEFLLNWLRGTAAPSAPATVYFALSTTDPGEDGSGITEPVGNGYARAAGTLAAATDLAGGVSTQPSAEVSFPSPTASWGTITDVALYDASSGGNLLAYGTLTSPQAVGAGNSPRFGTADWVLTINGISHYLGGLFVEWLRGTNMPAAPATVYRALSTADPGPDAAGLSEPPGANGYARQAATYGAPSQGANAATIANTAVMTFGPVTGTDWPQVTHDALLDASSGGNLLAYGALDTAQTVVVGNDAEYAVGQSTVSIA